MSKERQSRIDSKPSALPEAIQSSTLQNSSSGNETIASARSQSEFPITSESMANLSLKSTESKAERNVRSETEKPRKRRYGVYSVVPDSALIKPMNRPNDYGTVGTPIEIYTNHFPVSIDDAIVNQYDIEITMERDGKKSCPAKKNERWEVLQMLSKHEKNFPLVWYDEGKNLYTTELLTDFTKSYRVRLTINNTQKTFQFKVLNLVRQERIGKIFDFINGSTTIRPRDPIRMIETLFKQNIQNQYVCIKNKYYDRRQNLRDFREGISIGSGYHQALCLTRGGPTINLNLVFTCFYESYNFIEFACRYLRRDIHKGFNEAELEAMKQLFRNVLVKTNHTGRPIQYRFKSFGLPANQLKFIFESRCDLGLFLFGEITVADFFAMKYGQLRYPHLPCIDAGNGEEEKANWLPMETVEIVEWERAMIPFDSVLQTFVARMSSVIPDQRYNEIMNIVRKRDYKDDPYLKALNIRVNIEEMLKIQARILPPPEIKYRTQNNQDIVEHVRLGRWRIRNLFCTSATISKWAMIYFDKTPLNSSIIKILGNFEIQLLSLLRKYGIRMQFYPLKIAKLCERNEIEKTFTDVKSAGCQLAIVILNDVPPQTYNYIKKLGNQKLGLITQCTRFQELERNERNSIKLHVYVENLCQNLNVKLGGINGTINIKAALRQASNNDRFMFCGADVTHTTSSIKKPSIAAVVGSCDPTCTRYAARLSEQYPEKNSCSIEIIKDIDTMMIELLNVYARSCGNTLPNRIVFYRDGVADGQCQKVLDNEVNKIKAACRIVYGQNPFPRLTFIIVKKRHNTRFFTYDGKQRKNIEPGTVVDRDITHPSEFDFYLCSQAAIMGTSCPALYHVLQDENEFTSDEIQKLTYWLCHTDVRCTQSVSIPVPVHYAHLAAYASHAYDFGRDDNEVLESDEDEPTQMSLEQVRTQLMILDSSIQDTMWFV